MISEKILNSAFPEYRFYAARTPLVIPALIAGFFRRSNPGWSGAGGFLQSIQPVNICSVCLKTCRANGQAESKPSSILLLEGYTILRIKDKSSKIRQNIDLTVPLTQNLASCGSERASRWERKKHEGFGGGVVAEEEISIMSKLLNTMVQFRQDEEGAALVEYAVLLGIILAVTVGTFSLIGGSVATIFGNLQTMMASAAA